MAARQCANPDCGRDLIGRRPQTRTCSHACREKVHRLSRSTSGDELLRVADAVRRLIAEDGIDPLLALSYVVAPPPALRRALETVAA